MKKKLWSILCSIGIHRWGMSDYKPLVTMVQKHYRCANCQKHMRVCSSLFGEFEEIFGDQEKCGCQVKLDSMCTY